MFLTPELCGLQGRSRISPTFVSAIALIGAFAATTPAYAEALRPLNRSDLTEQRVLKLLLSLSTVRPGAEIIGVKEAQNHTVFCGWGRLGANTPVPFYVRVRGSDMGDWSAMMVMPRNPQTKAEASAVALLQGQTLLVCKLYGAPLTGN